jgi:hypothetical protein
VSVVEGRRRHRQKPSYDSGFSAAEMKRRYTLLKTGGTPQAAAPTAAAAKK